MGLNLIPTAPAGNSSGSSATVNTTSRAPAPYRYPAASLLLTDLMLFLRNILYVPQIIAPTGTTNPRGELYLKSVWNVWTLFVHIVFIVVGLAGFVLVPVFLYFPGTVFIGVAVAYATGVYAMAWLLNQTPEGELIDSGGEYVTEAQNEQFQEKWVFVNGVMAGRWWVQSALDELERHFGRRITAIHNRTFGVVLDLVQCLIQRDIGLTNGCVKNTYMQLRTMLLTRASDDDDSWKYKKIVVIAHSQGGLVLSLALDMLLADLADEILGRLEIYTFGNAANHFNNPPNTYTPTAGRHKSSAKTFRYPTIKHIEHYANEHDFVARFGVLAYHPKPNSALGEREFLEWSLSGRPHVTEAAYHDAVANNQFTGKLFVRKGKGGHQFVMHYLDEMFKQGDEGETVFMPFGTKDDGDGEEGEEERGKSGGLVVDAGAEGLQKQTDMQMTSRLWNYRGGRVVD